MDRSLIAWVPNRQVTFDLLNTTEWDFGDGEVSRWVRDVPDDLSVYDQVWIFRDDGSAVVAAAPTDPAAVGYLNSLIARP